MTSEHNSFSYDHSKFQCREKNPPQLNPSFPNRKPTEGEIDQFIELLKNSSASIQIDDNKQNNAEQLNIQSGVSDFKSEVTSTQFKSDSVVRSPSYKSNSRVVLNDDGILMKTIHVQSPNSYLKESELEHEQSFDLKDNNFHQSPSAYSHASYDYSRKTTYVNKNSKLRITISQEKNQSFSSELESREPISSDFDNRLISEEMMFSNKLEKETYSRDLGHSSRVNDSFADEFADSSSYSKYSRNPHPIGSNIRSSPTLSMYQRSSYPEDMPKYCEDSLYQYPENSRLRGKRDSSPNRSYYPQEQDKYSRHPFRNPRRSRTPSPPRKRLNSRDKDVFSQRGGLGFSDYDMRTHSPQRNDGRFCENRSPIAIPSPPSPPPPPILSALRKKKTKTKADQELSKNKKSTTDPLSTLLADRNVSISTLLEAAIGNTGEKSSCANLDQTTKADILSRCEEKIGQLYRHRVTGPGSFIPDPVPQPPHTNGKNSILVNHYSQFEFNNRTIDDIWHCPGVVEPDVQRNKAIQKPSIHSSGSRSTESKEMSNKGKDSAVRSEEYSASFVEHGIQYEGAIVSKISTYPSEEKNCTYKSVTEPPANLINCSEQWQPYGNVEDTSHHNAGYTSYALYHPPPLNAPLTYDTNNWSNSSVFNTFGYPQPQFENTQLVQYPVGYQPVGPYCANANYFVGQTENSQFPTGEFVQFPSSHEMPPPLPCGVQPDQWYPSSEQHNQFSETVQYPIKHTSNFNANDSQNSQSKNYENPNLISLTGKKTSQGNALSTAQKNHNHIKVLPVLTGKEDKNKSAHISVLYNSRCLVMPNINSGNPNTLEVMETAEIMKSADEIEITLKQILEQNEKIRNIQLDDYKIQDIIEDLEKGPKSYSPDYEMRYRILWRQCQKEYKIYISEPSEMPMLTLLHDCFHDLILTRFLDLARKYFSPIIKLQKKLSRIILRCSICRIEKSPKKMTDQDVTRRSRSPHNRINKSPLSQSPRKRRSRDRSKKSVFSRLSLPSTKPSNSSTNDSKSRVGLQRNKSPSPLRRRLENRSLKRRRDSPCKDRRGESQRSQYRSSSYDKYPLQGSKKSEHKKTTSRESSEVEAIAVIKLPSKQLEIIDLVEELNESGDDQWISCDSVGPDVEEDVKRKSASNQDVDMFDSIKEKQNNEKTNDDVSKSDLNKQNDELNKHVDSNNLMQKENQIQTCAEAGEEQQKDKTEKVTTPKEEEIKPTDGQKSESVQEDSVEQRQDRKEVKEIDNKNSPNVKEESISSEEKYKLENEYVKKDREEEERTESEGSNKQENRSGIVEKKENEENKEEEKSTNSAEAKNILKQENKAGNVQKEEKEDNKQEEQSTKFVETNRNVEKDNSGLLKQESKPDDCVKKEELEKSMHQEEQSTKSAEENSSVKKEEVEVQKQESEDGDQAKNSATQEAKNLQSNSKDEKKEHGGKTASNKEENNTRVELDFKTRIRNIQLECNELKTIINCIETNKNTTPCYLIKGGMLCKKYQNGEKNEVRIVVVDEKINKLVFTVHTMSSNHASVKKTLMLFNKHFETKSDIDKVVEKVVNDCQICNIKNISS